MNFAGKLTEAQMALGLDKADAPGYEICQLIDRATTDMNISGADWNINMQIVDQINATRQTEALSATMERIRLKLKSSKTKTVLLALNLLDTLVKNCQKPFHKVIGTYRFLSRIQKLYHENKNKGGRDCLEISEKCLNLIQSWGEAFLPLQAEIPEFTKTYHNMRKEGVKFGQTSQMFSDGSNGRESDTWARDQFQKNEEESVRNSAPSISTTDFAPAASPRSSQGALPASGDPQKVLPPLLETLRMVLEAAEDRTAAESELVQDLLAQCKPWAQKMPNVISEAVAAEKYDRMEVLLALNDSLNSVLQLHANLMKGAAFSSVPVADAVAVAASAPAPESDLVAFDAFDASAPAAAVAAAAAAAAPAAVAAAAPAVAPTMVPCLAPPPPSSRAGAGSVDALGAAMAKTAIGDSFDLLGDYSPPPTPAVSANANANANENAAVDPFAPAPAAEGNPFAPAPALAPAVEGNPFAPAPAQAPAVEGNPFAPAPAPASADPFDEFASLATRRNSGTAAPAPAPEPDAFDFLS